MIDRGLRMSFSPVNKEGVKRPDYSWRALVACYFRITTGRSVVAAGRSRSKASWDYYSISPNGPLAVSFDGGQGCAAAVGAPGGAAPIGSAAPLAHEAIE